MIFNLSGKRPELSDSELIEKFRYSHDLVYVAELYQRYTHLIMILCKKYLKTNEDCEDAALELFEILQRDLKKHQIKNFRTWLYSVTKNYCLKKLEKGRQWRAVDFDSSKFEEKLVEYSDNPDLQDVEVERNAQLLQLEKAISELPEGQKECIELFYLQETSYKVIAESTGYSLKQVKSFIQNGRRNLKLTLTK